jgi:hypothetical protein
MCNGLDIPCKNRKSSLPCPRVHILDVADLPQNPWSNNDSPEQLYEDGWDPADKSVAVNLFHKSLLPFKASTAFMV